MKENRSGMLINVIDLFAFEATTVIVSDTTSGTMEMVARH